MTSESNPETNGVAYTYTYDSDATCGASWGDLVKRVDPVGNVTCYAYDALHRNTSITYPSGPYAAATPERHFVYDGATVGGVAMANAKGRLAEAYTGPSTANITDLGFSYSSREEITDTYEATPTSAGYYHTSATYWDNGLMKTLATNISGLPAWTYGPDGEGRVSSIAASSGPNPLTSTSYSGFGTTGITFGSGDSDSFSYDPNTGRETQYRFTVNGANETGTLTWNANGTLQKLAISDPFIAANTQTCTNTYDDLMRLIANNCGSVWSQTFGYDAFGNITKSGTISFQPTYSPSTNRYNTLPTGTLGYDRNGNLTSDTFHNYGWNAEGLNTQIDSSATSMIYDALGRWVERRNAGTVAAVYGPDGRELAVTIGQTLVGAYVALPGGATALYLSSGQLGNWWHPDWLGTARLYSNPSHVIVGDAAYAPFGERYNSAPIDSFFTGVAQNVEANDFRNFPARDLHTTEGRWLTPDPAGLAAVDLTNPQTLNRSAYVMNDPLANVDPSGTHWEPGAPITQCYYTAASFDDQPAQRSCNVYYTLVWVPDNTGPPTGVAGGSSGGNNGTQPPKTGNLGLTNRQSCYADALVNGALGFIPGYNAAKTIGSLVGFNFNPVQFVNGNAGALTGFSSGASPVSAGSPTIPQVAAGITSAGAIYADASYAAAGGAAALSRAQDLISRGSFALKSASAQASLLQNAASLERLAQIASVAKNLGTVFNLASTAFDLYRCSQQP